MRDAIFLLPRPKWFFFLIHPFNDGILFFQVVFAHFHGWFCCFHYSFQMDANKFASKCFHKLGKNIKPLTAKPKVSSPTWPSQGSGALKAQRRQKQTHNNKAATACNLQRRFSTVPFRGYFLHPLIECMLHVPLFLFVMTWLELKQNSEQRQ